jgi:hypothetical protein
MKLISATALVVLTTLPAAAAQERPGPGDPIRPSGGICPTGTHLVHVSGERGIVDPDTRAYDDAEYTCEPDQQLEDAREGQGRANARTFDSIDTAAGEPLHRFLELVAWELKLELLTDPATDGPKLGLKNLARMSQVLFTPDLVCLLARTHLTDAQVAGRLCAMLRGGRETPGIAPRHDKVLEMLEAGWTSCRSGMRRCRAAPRTAPATVADVRVESYRVVKR